MRCAVPSGTLDLETSPAEAPNYHAVITWQVTSLTQCAWSGAVLPASALTPQSQTFTGIVLTGSIYQGATTTACSESYFQLRADGGTPGLYRLAAGISNFCARVKDIEYGTDV